MLVRRDFHCTACGTKFERQVDGDQVKWGTRSPCIKCHRPLGALCVPSSGTFATTFGDATGKSEKLHDRSLKHGRGDVKDHYEKRGLPVPSRFRQRWGLE